MSEAVSRLEQRVQSAIDRLGELGSERDALAREVERLRSRVEELEAGRVDATDGAAWVAHRRRALDELRLTLDELRAG